MPTTLETYSPDILQPAMFPEDERTIPGTFGASLTLAKGTVLGKKTSDSKLYAYAPTESVGKQAAVGICKYTIKTDANGKVYFGTDAVASSMNPPSDTAPVIIAGCFDTSDLTGWDADAATDLGARTLPNALVKF